MVRIKLWFDFDLLNKELKSCPHEADIMRKCWFVVEGETIQLYSLKISDLHEMISAQFAHLLSPNDDPCSFVLVLDDFVLPPSQSLQLLRDGDLVVVKKMKLMFDLHHVSKKRSSKKKSKSTSNHKKDSKKRKRKKSAKKEGYSSDSAESTSSSSSSDDSEPETASSNKPKGDDNVSSAEEKKQGEFNSLENSFQGEESYRRSAPRNDRFNARPVVERPSHLTEEQQEQNTQQSGSLQDTPEKGRRAEYQANKRVARQNRGNTRSYQDGQSSGTSSNRGYLARIKQALSNNQKGTQAPSRQVEHEVPKTPEKRNYQQVIERDPAKDDVLLFRALELSDNFTPKLSETKEAKVVNYDKETDVVTLRQLHPPFEVQKEIDGRQNQSLLEGEVTGDEVMLYERKWESMKHMAILKHDDK